MPVVPVSDIHHGSGLGRGQIDRFDRFSFNGSELDVADVMAGGIVIGGG